MNRRSACSDARPFSDPAGYVQAGRVSYRQIDGLFEQVGIILTKFSLLYRGASVPLDLEGAKDYERVLDLLAAAAGNQLSQAAGS